MGSDLKQRIIQSVRATWKTINDFAAAHRSAAAEQEMEEEVNSVIAEMQRQQSDDQADTEC
jgi:hypothetical protein